jgi:hypothetical protein
MCVPPIDNDGTFAPTGTPGMFIAFNDDALGGGTDQLWLYELTVNWTTTASSTFVRSQQIDVQPFSSDFGNNWNNIEQKGTNQRVDAIPQVVMNVPQYRNFGDHQTIVCCHTINMDGVRHAGIRWYELTKTTGTWSVRQQGTYAPDANSRWMGSIAMNGNHEIGMGYSISSTSVYPGILFCGQSAGENANATGIMDMTEDTIQVGTVSQTGANRWGDYAQVSVDPSDDKTFWFTTQYIGSGGSRKTKIASWIYAFAPLATTLPATELTTTSAKLNGTVNPNSQETSYHFEYGLTPISLTNSTPVVLAGSGSTAIDVSADITGLTAGTTYYYKIVAQSTGGVTAGLKVKFTTPLAPFMNVTPAHQNVTSSVNSTTFLVASNVDWTVSSDAGWCTTTQSGSGSDTIFVSVDENLLAASRTATITVAGIGVASQVVTVTQEGAAPMLSVNPLTANIPYTANDYQYAVLSNTNWTVVADQPWCTVTPSGSLNGTITASSLLNPAVTPRTTTITVTPEGLPPVTVSLIQDGAPIILSVNPANQNVVAAAGSTSFEVVSNINWTVQTDASWCTATNGGSGNGTILVSYEQNTSDQPRVAHLAVTSDGVNGPMVTVTQAKSSIGIGENGIEAIQLVPNPNKGQFRIVLPDGFNPRFELTISDLTGKLIYSKSCSGENDRSFNLPGIASGTYHVIIQTSEGKTVKKLVVL